MACEFGLGSWHVVRAWAVSHDGHDYLVHGLGKGLCHLMGTDWSWAMSYGHLARGLCLGSWSLGSLSIGRTMAMSRDLLEWAWVRSYDGHDHLARRLGMRYVT